MVQSASNPYAPARPFPALEWLKQRVASASAAKATPLPSVLSGELLDLTLLVSCLPVWLQGWLIAQLQSLVAQPWPPRLGRRWATSGRAGFLPFISSHHRLERLRARLLAELAAGLSIAATPPQHLSRPARNRALVARADAIGQVAGELTCQPRAGSLEQELARALAHLRR